MGAVGSGWLGGRMPRRMLLAVIYAARAAVMLVFLWLPLTPASAIAFGAATGLLWLSTVPLTSGLVALMFGTRWLGTLYGLAFLGHQSGSFLGVWLGGVVFEASGSYAMVWDLAIVLAVGAAMLNLLIAEKPLPRQRSSWPVAGLLLSARSLTLRASAAGDRARGEGAWRLSRQS